jgi:hypothetical protein
MKLATSTNKFIERPHITDSITDSEVLLASMQYFDKDGYELNHVEQLYHNNQNVDISHNFLYHKANHVPWYTDISKSESGAVLDHSMMMQRWCYTDSARDQIKRLSQKKPELNKLLSVRAKWGFDLSIDYVYDGGAFELFHIEYDYYDYDEAVERKAFYENIINQIDWESGVEEILKRKNEWEHLCSDDQADWKVQFFGFHRAFDNRKVFL